jgi:hypothetical protein
MTVKESLIYLLRYEIDLLSLSFTENLKYHLIGSGLHEVKIEKRFCRYFTLKSYNILHKIYLILKPVDKYYQQFCISFHKLIFICAIYFGFKVREQENFRISSWTLGILKMSKFSLELFIPKETFCSLMSFKILYK